MNRKLTLLIGLGLLGCACVALAITMSRLQKQAMSERPAPAERYAYLPAPSSSTAVLPMLWNAPDFLLTDQRGKPVNKAALAGHVWIADFIFTKCTTVCPLITAKMALLQRRIADPSVRFVSFSVDPEHDTEAALAKYARDWRPASENRWLLLRTEPKSLDQVVKGMHVALEKTNDVVNPIVHTAMFFLVDAQGSVRGVYDSGDDQKLERLVKDTQRLLGKTAAAMSPAKVATGEELYMTLGCGACHTRRDLAPSLDGLLGKTVALADAGSMTADTAYIRESIVAPGAKLTAGYLKLMPSYDQLSHAELDALVSYVSALRGKTPAAKTDAATEPVATLAHDPVCGMDVRVTKETPSATHAGHTHHFCSESCRAEFVAHPDAFLDAGAH